ncbi:MAG: hypothetical protein ACPGQD_01265 [Planctomycetota bacterium]
MRPRLTPILMAAAGTLAALLLVWGVLSGEAEAGPPPSPPSVALEQGDPAPFRGILLTPELAVQALKCPRHDLPLCELERRKESALLGLDLALCEDLRQIAEDRANFLTVQLDTTTRIEPPVQPWWKHPALWASVGVAVGVGVTVAIAQATR